jgi:hypothetical protein
VRGEADRNVVDVEGVGRARGLLGGRALAQELDGDRGVTGAGRGAAAEGNPGEEFTFGILGVGSGGRFPVRDVRR